MPASLPLVQCPCRTWAQRREVFGLPFVMSSVSSWSYATLHDMLMLHARRLSRPEAHPIVPILWSVHQLRANFVAALRSHHMGRPARNPRSSCEREVSFVSNVRTETA